MTRYAEKTTVSVEREGVLVQAIQEGIDALNKYADADTAAGNGVRGVVYEYPNRVIEETIFRMATARKGFDLDAYLNDRKDRELRLARDRERQLTIALQQIAFAAGHVRPGENPQVLLQLIRGQAKDALNPRAGQGASP